MAAIRRFNRFYTRRIGLLEEGHLRSPFSLTEVRVLYELANRRRSSASVLAKELELDPGYLSRILRRFEKQGFIQRWESKKDGRRSLLLLTVKGQSTFEDLNQRADQRVSAMLNLLQAQERARLVGAMETIQRTLRPAPLKSGYSSYLVRPHRPGDMGWVVHRHGALYFHEYQYDERFEALVAEIVSDFIKKLDPDHEHCWIAEKDGEIVGSVFLVKHTKTVAKLRLLLVEPSARGLGIGSYLIRQCVEFARRVGYSKITLWTQSELVAARHLYQQAGFKLVEKHAHQDWGRDDLVAEIWELKLNQ